MTQPIQGVDFWNASVDGYIGAAEPFTALFCADAVRVADIHPGMTLLDIATGPGALALEAARVGARVTAIDFAPAMIERLKARATGLDIAASVMDGQALALPDGQFDRACSVFGIPLFPDWRRGLAEMARVLCQGGRAVLGVAANPHGFGPNSLFAAARERVIGPFTPDIPAMAHLADPKILASEMQQAGFRDVEIMPRTHDFVMDAGMLQADHPMITQNPLLTVLAAAERTAVVDEALRAARSMEVAGQLRLPGTAHLAIAVRH
jgi:ubiquinone/menaquinone biosynthesis C-methylase UbiE